MKTFFKNILLFSCLLNSIFVPLIYQLQNKRTTMEIIKQIIGRMEAEGAKSASPLEIKKCLSGCVASKKLYQIAMQNRNELCKYFCNNETNKCECVEN